MRLILQRVTRASVKIDGETIAAIDTGVLALVGIEKGDGEEQVRTAADKLVALRIFADEQGRMNYDVRQAGGSMLLVSQFTLAASLARGRRPSFDAAAKPDIAEPLIHRLEDEVSARDVRVCAGRFGAYMQIELVNDGPVTFVLEVPPSD